MDGKVEVTPFIPFCVEIKDGKLMRCGGRRAVTSPLLAVSQRRECA